MQMRLISIAELFTHPYIQQTIALFNLTKEQLQQTFNNTHIHNLWSMLNLYGLDNASFTHRCVRYYLETVFGADFNQKNEAWYVKTFLITEELFNRIQEITLIAAGIKKFSEQSAFNASKPQWLIEKEAEIQRIKRQNNKGSVNQFEELMKTLISLNYELSYSFEELFKMNYFHIQYLSQYISKIVSYDIGKRQVFAKKAPKYITEK